MILNRNNLNTQIDQISSKNVDTRKTESNKLIPLIQKPNVPSSEIKLTENNPNEHSKLITIPVIQDLLNSNKSIEPNKSSIPQHINIREQNTEPKIKMSTEQPLIDTVNNTVEKNEFSNIQSPPESTTMLSGGSPTLMANEMGEQVTLFPCGICGRTFNEKALKSH